MLLKNLLIVWIATIGVDRIDFTFGKASFVLTPFILLSLGILAVYLGTKLFKISDLNTTIHESYYDSLPLLLLGYFLFFVLLSVIAGYDFDLGIKRFVLLLYEIVSVIIITRILLEHDLHDIISKGSKLAILLFLFFDVLQLSYWFLPDFANMVDSIGCFNLLPPSLGQLAPRPSGFSLDMNRGGILLIFFVSNILTFAGNKRHVNLYISLAFLLVLITFSRSAILSFLLFIAVYYALKKGSIQWGHFGINIAGIFIFIACILFLLQQQTKIDLTALITERGSISKDESGGMHFDLIVRGISVWTDSIKNIMFGIGFGSSYTVLEDFFDYNNKYSNFHSIYIAIIAETGIFSFICFMILMINPIFHTKKYIPILWSLLFFNVFYQILLDPFFWLVILWSWINLGFSNSGDHSPCALRGTENLEVMSC